MNVTAARWTLEGFVRHFHFVHHHMLDHKFVWVLGAGASSDSLIPLAGKLVDDWLEEMHIRECSTAVLLKDWATADQLGIKDFEFDKRSSFYPKVYERRFRDYPDEGFAFLESVMSKVDPSPGYSILAVALAKDPPRHNVVITTNFDNLVADALSIYTDTFPFVAGHESLTGFVRVSMRRPLICKIHRDLLLGPQNDPRSLKRLHDAWGTALRALFEHYTPLFIGYGGNDDTLMDLLESLQPSDIKGQIIWCYYEEAEPNERIVKVVGDLNGVLVPVPKFDLLMLLLGEAMEIALLDEEIGRRAEARTRRYRDRIQGLDTAKYPSVERARNATVERSGGWWAWDQKARLEKDVERCETVYRDGIDQYPQSAELAGNFANFLTDILTKHDEAETFYRKALDLAPDDAMYMGNFATFMTEVRNDSEEAERLYRRALELDPNQANNVGNFALFMDRVRRDYVEAERFYRTALDIDRDHANNIGLFAWFKHRVRKDYDEAEQLYCRSLELESTDVFHTTNFAIFMTEVRKDYDEAERLYRKALELDPHNVYTISSFAQFHAIRHRLKQARELGIKAWELLDKVPSSDHGTVAFTRWVLDRASGLDSTPALAFMKTLIQTRFPRDIGSFEQLLAAVAPQLPEGERTLARKLGDAILDDAKVAELTNEPVWEAIKPITLEVPWLTKPSLNPD